MAQRLSVQATHARSCDDLWITTGERIAANFLRHETGAA